MLRADPRLPGKRLRELLEEQGYEGCGVPISMSPWNRRLRAERLVAASKLSGRSTSEFFGVICLARGGGRRGG